MKIVIIGGSGLIGSRLSTRLRNLNHEIVPASLDTGVNTITGEGLFEVLEGADVVIDVANSPSLEGKAALDFFETSTRNLLQAEHNAGVRHHVALSVAGTDRLQESWYFRGKQAQENLIVSAGIPYSIVHSTQFFEFVGGIIAASTIANEVRLAPVDIQPIAADDVVKAVAEVATGDPVNGIIEIAGPDLFSLPELAMRYLLKTEGPRTVKVDSTQRYFGALLDVKTLVPEENARIGSTSFATWMDAQLVTSS